MSTYQVVKELVLSTTHMPRWMADAMDRFEATKECDPRLEWISFDPVTYGYLVWVREDGVDEDIPEELREPMRIAKTLGCDWIRFDEAGPCHDNLSSWIW